MDAESPSKQVQDHARGQDEHRRTAAFLDYPLLFGLTLQPRGFVGIDIVSAALLPSIAVLGHLYFGYADLKLVGILLLGSTPRIILRSPPTTQVVWRPIKPGAVAGMLVTNVGSHLVGLKAGGANALSGFYSLVDGPA